MTTVGDRIRTARDAKRLPRTALAALIGVSTATVKRWETGQSYPDALEIHRIAISTQSNPFQILGDGADYYCELELRDRESKKRARAAGA